MPARILIVEDQPINALGLKRELVTLGHEVVGIAASASEAIRGASELKPELILMDIGLAGDIDGIAAATVIRGQENIPVVFLTSYSDDATLDRAMKASPFGYILKPFETREVEAAIRVALYRHSKEMESRTLVRELAGDLNVAERGPQSPEAR